MINNPFKKTKYGFETNSELSDWRKIFDKPCNIEIAVVGSSIIDEIKPEHIDAYYYIMKNQAQLLNTLLNALLEKYPEIRNEYRDYFGKGEQEQFLHGVKDISQFKNLITPISIFILDIIKGGICCIGFEFNCTWEEEHRLGFMTYNGKVYGVDFADLSYTEWMAEKCINN